MLKKDVEILERKLSKTGERASSNYSGEGTEHISNPKKDLARQFTELFTIRMPELRSSDQSASGEGRNRDKPSRSPPMEEQAESLHEKVKDLIRKEASRQGKPAPSDKESEYLANLLRNAGLDEEKNTRAEGQEEDRRGNRGTSAYGDMLRGRDRVPQSLLYKLLLTQLMNSLIN